MNTNNLFQYATKELSQDAMLCWLINWVNYPEKPLHPVGEAVLNLFLGKKQKYHHVEVKRQYKKIDVLILFNDRYALIIEDKTNTSEHSDQIARYQDIIKEEYPNREILTSYVKTGIIYDEDARIIQKTDTVVVLDDLLRILSPFAQNSTSEILCDYVLYLSSIADNRKKIDEQIHNRDYSLALSTHYGQFSFLNQIFNNRSTGTEIGETYHKKEKNSPIYIDYLYAGTNNGGTPWTQYCFWGQKYPEQIVNGNKIEYHYLFWRIDCKWKKDPDNKYVPTFYIALRHYDENTKVNDATRERKKEAYQKFRTWCKEKEKMNPDIFDEIGTRENYKESDLLFIPVDKIRNKSFDEIKDLLTNITKEVLQQNKL